MNEMATEIAATSGFEVHTTNSSTRPAKTLQINDDEIIHIVDSNDHAEQLEREFGQPFNFTIKGSPEHVKALRDARAHHHSKHEALRQKHPDVCSEMQRLRAELDRISEDIHATTSMPVHLEANFGKFGYSANVRTRQPETDLLHSGASSVKSGHASTTIKFYKTPVIRQYFHEGLLWRAAEVEEVASFELFVDLLYVGIIAINGDKALEEPSAEALLRFCISFIPGWRLWSDITLLVSWFETDDIQQRLGVLFIISCLVGYTTNLVSAFDSTYSQLIAFYLAARLFVALVMFWMSFAIPIIKATLWSHVVTIIIPSVLWIGSTALEEPEREVLIWLAMFLDFFGSFAVVALIRGPIIISKGFTARLRKNYDFYPAVNIEHKTERQGAFVTLVFGYAVVALLYQNQARFGLNAFAGKAILGLLQSFVLNTIYFDIDGSNHYRHAIRRHAATSCIWLSAHLPFVMAFTLSGAALSHLVVAHDCRDANIEDLTDKYQAVSAEILEPGTRWFYCGGLGLALLCMTIISATHEHRHVNTQRLRKLYRLIYRVGVAIVTVCLPLAGDRLDSLSLVSITAALVVSVLFVDIYGTSCVNDTMFAWGKKCKKCCYTATLIKAASNETLVADDPNTPLDREGNKLVGEKGYLDIS